VLSEKPQCRYCGATLVVAESSVGGRPSEYCRSGCRRAAQSERQRITRYLEAFEVEAMALRHDVERGWTMGIVAGASILRPAERLADVERDIATLRWRLAELLNGVA
jgi:hypothetical protein